MRSVVLVCAALLVAAACGTRPVNDSEAPRGRGVAQPVVQEAPPSRGTSSSSHPRNRAGDPTRGFERPSGDDYRAPAVRVDEPARTVTESAPSTAHAPERDLAAELRALAGSPASCADGVDLSHAPAQLTVSLEAHVTPAGVVSRASASVSGAPQALADCMRRRIEAGHFTSPVLDAPRSVQATLTVNRVAVPPPAAPTAPTSPTVR